MTRGAVLLGGLHPVRAVLQRSPERVRRLMLERERDDAVLREIDALARAQGIAIERVAQKKLDAIVDVPHQGVIAECIPAPVLCEADLLELVARRGDKLLLLVLDGVTDPRNLGACLRVADAAGVHAVVLPKDRSAGPGPVVSKAAAGAAEVIPLVQVTNLVRCLQSIKKEGVWVTGTAEDAPQAVFSAKLTGARAIVMGSEDRGMRRLVKEQCDELVFIPMAGSVASLNVSVAAGICLFECVRQRRG